EDLATADLVNQAEKLLADDLNVLLVQNAAVNEVHHRNVANVLDLKATTARRLRHRRDSLAKMKPLRASLLRQRGQVVEAGRSNFLMLDAPLRKSSNFRHIRTVRPERRSFRPHGPARGNCRYGNRSGRPSQAKPGRCRLLFSCPRLGPG